MSDGACDVRKDQYPTVIREMIRHEDDVTNHRIMWLLVGQGFLANAFVVVKNQGSSEYLMLCFLGIVVALSAFVTLYQSYQARGYLQFLGLHAKTGILREEDLPLTGWPENRLKGWQRNIWILLGVRKTRDLFEPWLTLPFLFTCMWTMSVLHAHKVRSIPVDAALGIIISGLILFSVCGVLFWTESKNEVAPR